MGSGYHQRSLSKIDNILNQKIAKKYIKFKGLPCLGKPYVVIKVCNKLTELGMPKGKANV
ncbi:hypothetical protein BTN50_1800 [Candidatus Enterovibrio altilux]|uniref:Mobile element protein n=1 Tax=Candidatus Enterovibrio altilux TaxID=1927128 RepID=A0A291BB46_9GAMM|nr:hypothetical protein BTN50_1800 [Candidatus Enterovibrio luxaltus]